MDWSIVKARPGRKVLRQFAGIWLVLFLCLAAQNQFLKSRPAAASILAIVALVVGLPGLAWPRAVGWVFSGTMILAFPIGWCVSNGLLAVIYFGVVTPIGLVLRWFGRDELGLKPAPRRESFWEVRSSRRDVASYLRQY